MYVYIPKNVFNFIKPFALNNQTICYKKSFHVFFYIFCNLLSGLIITDGAIISGFWLKYGDWGVGNNTTIRNSNYSKILILRTNGWCDYFGQYVYKETGQYRKGELGLKPENIKEFKSILGLQKSPICPICITIES